MKAFSVTAVYAQQHSPNPSPLAAVLHNSIGQTPTGCTQQQHTLKPIVLCYWFQHTSHHSYFYHH